MFNCTLISDLLYKTIKNNSSVAACSVSLVDRVVVLVSGSDGFPHSSSYQSVTEPHPDTFPDVLLYFVVILGRMKLINNVEC